MPVNLKKKKQTSGPPFFISLFQISEKIHLKYKAGAYITKTSMEEIVLFLPAIHLSVFTIILIFSGIVRW